jgi:carboxymethylenebutenolidase
MKRHIINGDFDGRRFLARVLLGVTVVVWGAGVAWAQDKPKSPESKPAEYVDDTFQSSDQTIRIWRFDPKEKEKQPAVLLLHGADGGVGVEKMYCGLAKRVADKGYVVFIVHYLDVTTPEDRGKVSAMVKRAVRGEATPAEAPRVQKFFDTWTRCVTDAVGHVRKQPGVDGERIGIVGLSLGGFVGLSTAAQQDLKIAAVVSGFGGLPRERRDSVNWLPPTLIVHGDEDDVVPIQYAVALRQLRREKKLPIDVVIYPEVGHVFQKEGGKFDLRAMMDAERLTTEHLQKYLKPSKASAEVASEKAKGH